MLPVVVEDEQVVSGGSSSSQSGGVSTDEGQIEYAARITHMVNDKFDLIEKTSFNDDYRKSTIKYLIEKGKNVVPGL